MDHSFSNSVSVSCSACGQAFNIDAWVIIVQNSRPELIQQLQEKKLNVVICPHCNQQMGFADEPLLLYRPSQDPQIIFSPAQKTLLSEDQAHHMHKLVQHLLDSLQSDDTEWVVENSKRMPRQKLLSFMEQA